MALKRKTSVARTPTASKPAKPAAASRRPVAARAKPASTKPASTKPARAKPASTKPASTKPASTKPTKVADKSAKRAKAPSAADKLSNRAKLTLSRGASPATLVHKIAFTMFQVEDAVRARGFYEDVLGFKRGLASPEGTWTEYDLPGGGCLALFRHPDPKAVRSIGGACVALEVTDLDALNERLQQLGVVYKGEMVHGPHCRMSNILDSEGNTLILHQLNRD
jgi:predicted enzyme related to lactoylglutathione lyase